MYTTSELGLVAQSRTVVKFIFEAGYFCSLHINSKLPLKSPRDLGLFLMQGSFLATNNSVAGPLPIQFLFPVLLLVSAKYCRIIVIQMYN